MNLGEGESPTQYQSQIQVLVPWGPEAVACALSGMEPDPVLQNTQLVSEEQRTGWVEESIAHHPTEKLSRANQQPLNDGFTQTVSL